MSDCADCNGAGKTVGYACPGFRRVEVPCGICGGTGQEPPWRREALNAGSALRAARQAKDVSVREEARRLGLSPAVLCDVELGRVPITNWPDVLRSGGGEGAAR